MIHFITGGSGSGKSAYAEDWIMQTNMPCRVYAATMKIVGDEERRKVNRHQTLRAGKGFITLECPSVLELSVLSKFEPKRQNCAVLLECISNLAANELFCDRWQGDGKESSLEQRAEQVFERIKTGILQVDEWCDRFAVVSSEVFSDGIEYLPETMAYLRLLGRLNCWIAKKADQVTEVVYGIPLTVKLPGGRGKD